MTMNKQRPISTLLSYQFCSYAIKCYQIVGSIQGTNNQPWQKKNKETNVLPHSPSSKKLSATFTFLFSNFVSFPKAAKYRLMSPDPVLHAIHQAATANLVRNVNSLYSFHSCALACLCVTADAVLFFVFLIPLKANQS